MYECERECVCVTEEIKNKYNKSTMSPLLLGQFLFAAAAAASGCGGGSGAGRTNF